MVNLATNTWPDLTNRGNDMTLYGGVSYSGDFGGILSFNSSDYAYLASLVDGTITSTWTGECRQLATRAGCIPACPLVCMCGGLLRVIVGDTRLEGTHAKCAPWLAAGTIWFRNNYASSDPYRSIWSLNRSPSNFNDEMR